MTTLQTYFFSTSPTHEGFAVYQLLKPNQACVLPDSLLDQPLPCIYLPIPVDLTC